MLSKNSIDNDDTIKLNKKIKKLASSDKFKQSYPEIAKAYENYQALRDLESGSEENDSHSDERKAAMMKEFKKLEEAVSLEKSRTSSWNFARKAKLSAFSKYIAIEMKNALSKKEIYQRATDNLIAGPRNKNDATIALESVVQALLDPDKKASTHYHQGELIITIDDEEYNMTDILDHKPDFDQLRFSKEELSHYQTFQEKKGLPTVEVLINYELISKSELPLQPYQIELSVDEKGEGYSYRVRCDGEEIKTGLLSWDQLPPDAPRDQKALASYLSDNNKKESLLKSISDCQYRLQMRGYAHGKLYRLKATEQNYDKTDTESQHLTYPEKLAITLYTGEDIYKKMQTFLRTSGRAEKYQNTAASFEDVKELLLGISVAAHALSKPLSIDHAEAAPPLPSSSSPLEPSPPSTPPPTSANFRSKREILKKASPEAKIPTPTPPPPPEPTYELLSRGEEGIDSINRRRQQDLKDNKVTSNTGFISTSTKRSAVSAFISRGRQEVILKFIQPVTGMARNIAKLSNIRGEDERLLPPGAEYKIIEYSENKDRVGILAVPVRSLDNVSDPHAYSKFTFNKKMAAMKVKLQVLEKKMKNPANTSIYTNELIALSENWKKEKARIEEYLSKYSSKSTQMKIKYEPEDAAIDKKLRSLDKEFEKLNKKYNLSIKKTAPNTKI